MTTVITGIAGSGKSTEITKRIIDDLRQGTEVVLLVPEQRAVRTERALALECQEARVPQTGLEVLNFRRLCNSYFRRYGGICGKKADERLKALVMWKAYARAFPYLKKYSDMLGSLRRFVPVLLGQAEEFKRYGVTAAMLDRASGEFDGEGDPLGEKLRESGLIFAEYARLLDELGQDALDDLGRVAEGLPEHRFFEGKKVYCDGFSGFTPDEARVVREAVRQAADFTIALTVPENERANPLGVTERAHFTKPAGTLKMITGADRGAVRIATGPCMRPAEIGAIAEGFGGTAVPFGDERKNVRFAALADPYECAEFIACDIIAKTRDNGAKYADFAIVYGSEGVWSTVLEAVLEKHGIPAHSQRKTPLRETPLFRLVMSAVEIKRQNWEPGDVMSLLKSGLTPFSAEEIGTFGAYLQTWGLRGERAWKNRWEMNPRGYSGSAEDRESLGEILGTVNRIRELLYATLSAFYESLGSTAKETAAALYRALCDLGAKEKSGEGENARNWNAMCDVLDIIVQAFGDTGDGQRVKEGLFFDLLETAVDMTVTGAIPAGADEVMTGRAGGPETCNTPYIYLYGCNEGIFPPESANTGLFTDADKEALEEYGIVLSPRVEYAIFDRRLDFYVSACGAGRELTLVRALRSEKGEKLSPSPEYAEIRRLFPENSEITAGELERDLYLVQDLPSAREANGILYGTRAGLTVGAALNEKFAPGSFSGTPAETLAPEFMKELNSGGLRLSNSSITRYADCGFSYACRYALKITAQRDGELNPADAGTFVHFVLEKFFRRLGDEGKYPRIPLMTVEQTEEYVREFAGDYYRAVLGENGTGALGPKVAARFERLIRSTVKLVMEMVNDIATGDYIPSFFELPVADRPGALRPRRIVLNDGTVVTVTGKIDRVDVMEAGNMFFFRVIDYKTGQADFKADRMVEKDVKQGRNLQMPIYMFTLEENGSRLLGEMNRKGEFLPAGILYYRALYRRKVAKAGEETDAAIERLNEQMEPVGVLLDDRTALEGLGDTLKRVAGKIKRQKIETRDPGYFAGLRDAVDAEIREIAGGIMEGRMGCDPRIISGKSPCRYCDYRDICRSPVSGAGQ